MKRNGSQRLVAPSAIANTAARGFLEFGVKQGRGENRHRFSKMNKVNTGGGLTTISS